jgi:HTH-type transcriptional regulator, sugar sensing transcriptional regulator
MDTQLLLEAGLTEREIKVYLALLELGSTSTGPLVKKSGIPNCKVYEALEKLINKGLASYIIVSKVKHFQASDPEMLLNFIDEKKKRIKEIIPELKSKQNLKKKAQEATIYEGIRGFKTAMERLLQTVPKNGLYEVFTLGEELNTEELRIFFLNFHAKRRAKKIKAKLIAPYKLKKIFAKHYKECGLNTRYTKLSLPTGIFIYENNVMTVIWGEKPSAFIITSKNNADRYRSFFNTTWEQATP